MAYLINRPYRQPIMKKLTILFAPALIFGIALGLILLSLRIAKTAHFNKQRIQLNRIELKNTQLQLDTLEKKLDQTTKDKNATDAEKLRLQQENN